MARVFQTSEKASKNILKTRWYKANYKVTKNAVLKVLENCGFEPLVTDDNYGEIFIENNNFTMTITIFEFSMTETSVDVSYESKRFFEFGQWKKDIIMFYSKISDIIEFKGLSLHP